MKNLPILFCGALLALSLSVMGLVLSSHIQLSSLTQSTETLDENGLLLEGETLYPLTLPGLAQQGEAVYADLGCVYCHTQQVRREGLGGDVEREWAKRGTVARDYVTDSQILLGQQRVGPDLKGVGERLQDPSWHHLHLYNPRITSGGISIMPSFKFLYETREIEGAPSAKALQFEPGSPYAAKPGYEVVPTPRAEALVAYLLSRKLNYSLPEARISE